MQCDKREEDSDIPMRRSKMAVMARFTDRARKVMQLANQEAQRFNHEYIGTEHLLLGLVAEGSGVAVHVLRNLDLDPDRIRREVEGIVQPGSGDDITMSKLPQTPRAKKVIEYAIEEARNLNHNYVGTEHLLLGLLREQEGVAARILMNLGLNLDQVREEVLSLLGGPTPDWQESDRSIGPKESSRDDRPPHRRYPEPDEDLSAETQHWPEPIRASLRELEAQIEQFRMEKETAVAEQDFERAAQLLDQERKLIGQERTIVQRWRGRIKVLTAIADSDSPTARALALAVLAGDWSALPILADALEDAGDLRSHVVRSWATEG